MQAVRSPRLAVPSTAEPPPSAGRARALVAVFVLVLATRLPFVLTGTGVGADPDSWRLLLAGQMFADSGVYRTSRLPGYPVVEMVSAALAGSPWWVYVLATAVVGALAVVAFADLLRTLRVRSWWWPTAAMAVTPVVYRSDLTFMDYSWSLAAALGSFAVLARGRPLWAGLLLGVAIGCRPASAVLLVVALAFLIASRASWRAWTSYVVPALVVGGACASVPVLAFGRGALSPVWLHASAAVTAARASTAVWGTLGAVAVGVAVVTALVGLARSRHDLDPDRRSWTVAAVAGLVAMAGLFLMLPADPAYLLPAVPMVLLLVALGVGARAIAALAVVLALSSFVAPWGSARFSPTVLSDRHQRDTSLQAARRATAGIAALPPYKVIIAGSEMPQLLALQPRAVLANPLLSGPIHEWNVPSQVPVGVSSLLAGSDPGLPPIVEVYRLPGVTGDRPLLPMPR